MRHNGFFFLAPLHIITHGLLSLQVFTHDAIEWMNEWFELTNCMLKRLQNCGCYCCCCIYAAIEYITILNLQQPIVFHSRVFFRWTFVFLNFIHSKNRSRTIARNLILRVINQMPEKYRKQLGAVFSYSSTRQIFITQFLSSYLFGILLSFCFFLYFYNTYS